MLFASLNAPAFFVAFFVGMVICYFSTPPPRVVVKFPSPQTAGKVTYRSAHDDGSCFRYRAERHACPLPGATAAAEGAQVVDQPTTSS